MGIFKMNKRIIDMYNSQIISEFTDLMDEIVQLPKEKIEKIFKSKLYVWNIIRNKDFYKLMSVWFINTDTYTDANFLILKLVLETANNDITRKTLMKSIVKKKIILTVDSIKYIEGLDLICTREYVLDFAVDDYIKPLIARISSLEMRLDDILMIQ